MRRALGQDNLRDQHVGLLRERLPDLSFPFRGQTEPPALIKRLEDELALDVASSDSAPLLQALQRAQWPVKREEVVGGGAVGPAAGLQRDSIAVNVDNRAARATTAGCCAGLVVTRVEVTVPVAVFGRVAIQPANDTRENAELLAGIVTDHPDLNANLGKVGPQRQGSHRHVLDGLRIELENAEVVDGIAVDRVRVDFFVVVEDAVTPEWARADDVTVCQDVSTRYPKLAFRPTAAQRGALLNQPSLGIDDEAGRLARQGRICVKGTCLAEADRHDVPNDALDCCLPLGGVCARRQEGRQPGVFEFLVLALKVVGPIGGIVAGRQVTVQTVVLRVPAIDGLRRLLALGAGGRTRAVHGVGGHGTEAGCGRGGGGSRRRRRCGGS